MRLILMIVCLLEFHNVISQETSTFTITATTNDSHSHTRNTFLYFGYGSNLMAERIRINNPTAVRISSAKLMDYRIDFGNWSERWRGAVATIVPEQDKQVWGAVWELNNSDMANLDRQEGVSSGIYFPLEVEVVKPAGEKLQCRCYQLCNSPAPLESGEPIPEDRLPSELYLNVIIRGALETGLPDDYIEQLNMTSCNAYKGDSKSNLTHLMSS